MHLFNFNDLLLIPSNPANSLYGMAMSQPLPIGNFKWIEDRFHDYMDEQPSLFSDVNAIMDLKDDGDTGFIFEVDLEYPKHLHRLHNDFPFCPERKKLPKDAIRLLGGGVNTAHPKLLLTLENKEKYVIHYRMLKLALHHGLILKKVHRILQFDQSLWLKSYIDLNIEMRKKAQNDFDKAFYKYLINAIFGKTMENIRSRVDIKIANKFKGGRSSAQMLIARPNFKRFTIFDENLVAIELKRTQFLFDKPIIIGMSVLDISKTKMYGFYYGYLKQKYAERCELAYTDTDSFILDIQTDDFYADMRENSHLFDTSDYPLENEYGIERKNKKVIGAMKDELNGSLFIEFCGLRAKAYAVRSLENGITKDKMKKSKGIKKNVVKRRINFNDYLQCIQNQSLFSIEQKNIRSIKHRLFSIHQKKVGLNPFDDKRFIIPPEGVKTLAWGNHEIEMYTSANN